MIAPYNNPLSSYFNHFKFLSNRNMHVTVLMSKGNINKGSFKLFAQVNSSAHLIGGGCTEVGLGSLTQEKD